MIRTIGLAIVVSITMLIGNSYGDDTKKFTVSGEWLVREPGTPAEHQKMMNSLHTSVVIARVNADAEDSSDEPVLATGSFNDGKVFLEGEIDERTNVLISVTRGKEEPMTLPAVLIPGATTSFALWDKHNSFPGVEDQLILIEDFKLAEESDDKFTITGDLSAIEDKDLSVAVAHINVRSSNPKDGSVLSNRSNQVLLNDGRFSIEGIATEPLLIGVWVQSQVDVYAGHLNVVIEPGAQISISPSASSSSFAPGGRASELMANSEKEGSFHSKVIESWQNSDEYLEKMDEYASAMAFEAQKSLSDSETEEEQTDIEDPVAESIKSPYDVHKEMSAIKNAVLTAIAQNLDEPISALLAMELGAGSRQLENWDAIANVLDEDTVARRVIPQRETLEKQIRVAKNTQTIIAGHVAPDFTLTNLEGEDVALYDDVLANNEVVLIDFWASWCGPCVAKIPKLKEFHAEYKDKGFEVVFVSIDDTYDDWKTGSDGHEVPGINVGDLNGFLGETPVDYGVTWIPSEFLLQPDGEILNRGLTMEELETLLDERFGSATKKEKADIPTSEAEAL